MRWRIIGEKATRVSAFACIVIFFIVALEIMIMISPFAFFFYSVFNPIFSWLDQFSSTRWLTSFFLPHMILPPTIFLKTVRISGSVFFIIGAIVFAVCALQVYLGKLFKWGIADKGLYKYIRHPQYLALGIWGIGMSILWPRFIVLATLSAMFVLYYILAKDEEKRMSTLYGESYRAYVEKTGMFIPRFIERLFSFVNHILPMTSQRYVAIPIIIIIFVIGSGFILREITLFSLHLETRNNLTVLSVLPEDNRFKDNVIDGIIEGQRSGKIILSSEKDYLGYLMPADYIMQGMIANTGSEFHLFKQQNTIAMISEWVLHPFQHLRTSPAFHMAKMHHVDPVFARRHHCPIGIDNPSLDCNTCPYRRLIIDEVAHGDSGRMSGNDVLSFDAIRVPVYSVDINTETGEIVNIIPVEKATAWADVPTPSI
ncbi:MAG: isoprenylcysteine carboxylmethyltransferase family protein [Syntrophales bacterium]